MKIEKIVEKIVPIHEASYESENENDMTDLIEDFQRMDIEWLNICFNVAISKNTLSFKKHDSIL